MNLKKIQTVHEYSGIWKQIIICHILLMMIHNLMNIRDVCDPIKLVVLLKRERRTRLLMFNSGPPRNISNLRVTL